jgi:hypothetical protein
MMAADEELWRKNEMKTCKRTIRKKTNRTTRRGAWYWIAVGAMSSWIGYTAAGMAVTPAYAAPIYLGRWIQAGPVRQFDIPAGPLDAVIESFNGVAGVRATLSREGIRTIPSPGVTGSFAVDEALRRIHLGTGVTYRYKGSETI